jgi:hypothetical protein
MVRSIRSEREAAKMAGRSGLVRVSDMVTVAFWSALVRVKVVAGRHEGLVDRSCGDPTEQVLRGVGLVVGAGGTGTAERLAVPRPRRSAYR